MTVLNNRNSKVPKCTDTACKENVYMGTVCLLSLTSLEGQVQGEKLSLTREGEDRAGANSTKQKRATSQILPQYNMPHVAEFHI